MKAMTKKEKIFLYLPPQKLKLASEFETICKKMHLCLFLISDNMLSIPLSQLVFTTKIISPQENYQPLPDTLMILKDFRNSSLNSLLSALKKNGIIVNHKAILTPSNSNWTPKTLFYELDKEHRALHPDIK